MPVPRKLLKAAFAVLSTKSLRAAAGYHDLENWETRAPASLAAELGDDDGYNLGTCMYDWKAPELKKVAQVLGVELPSADEGDIRGAIGTFIEEYDNRRTRARAGKQAGKLPTLTVEDLRAEADQLGRPVLLLKPRGGRQPVAVWSADDTRKVQGERAWITVDLRHHPDQALRRNGVLDVFADDAEGTGRAVFRPGPLRRPQGKEVYLYPTAATDRPALEVIFRKGSKQLQTWLDQVAAQGWDLRAGAGGPRFPFHDLLESYRRTWQAGHALYSDAAAAQLGGWPLTWPDEGAEEQFRRPLVLRTYRAAEPWVEVFQKGRTYQVRLRIT
jgi:hypothetical protein